MMKTLKPIFLPFLLLLCLSGLPGKAQDKYAGSFYVYDYEEAPALTPAPQGYKPFYISHFARHGARYCTSEYDRVFGILSKGEAAGVLNEGGKAFFARYKPFYNKVRYSSGNLTGVGKAQHRAIAEHMYARFPEVFDGPTKVEAFSTESPRVIQSMWSCLSALQGLDGDIALNADASGKYAPWLQPNLSSNPYYDKAFFRAGKQVQDAVESWYRETVPCEEIAARFFRTMEGSGATAQQFVSLLGDVVSNTWCLDEDRGAFDDVLTTEERELLWKGATARGVIHSGNYAGSESRMLDYVGFTLEQIIVSAGTDISSGAVQLRLRFGHDAVLAPLLALLNVNGYGEEVRRPEDAAVIYPSYAIPMGASLQLVFFRGKEPGDILLQVLVNEREARLPGIPAVNGAFYRWKDFHDYYLPLAHARKNRIRYARDLEALKAADWGWKSVGGSKVETGTASLKVFGAMQTVSLIRFPLKEHSVSIYSAAGPKAAVTSELGARAGAKGAVNGGFFDGELQPITYLKDEGKTVCRQLVNNPSLFNGMFRIKDRKGRQVDIVRVDSLSTEAAAKGWREAIVCGPLLMEDGEAVFYENDGTRAYRHFHRRRHPRTLLGYTADGWMYLISVDGRFQEGVGMTVPEMQVLCQALGLYEALNLDGGGSATMWSRDGGVLNHPYDNLVYDHAGERVVPNAIIVK